MKNIIVFISVIAILSGCGEAESNGKNKSGNKKVKASDFVSFFPDITLPVTIHDSIFTKKQDNSSVIETTVLYQFVSDSIFKKEFDNEKVKVYAVGKFSSKNEIYLLIKAVANNKQALYVAALSKQKKFLASLLLLSSKNRIGSEKIAIDNKCTFTYTYNSKASDGSTYPLNTVYVCNSGVFMVILTDAVPGTDMPISNPIDTLPHKGKFSGNYEKDKRNFISFRDGAVSGALKFFIHIEGKEIPFCNGELQGEARIIDTDSASYTNTGSPCTLGFKFSSNKVHITENNCGNKHGLDCSFNGSFIKQKEKSIYKNK